MHIRNMKVTIQKNGSVIEATVDDSWFCGLHKTQKVYTLTHINNWTGNTTWVGDSGEVPRLSYLDERLSAEFQRYSVYNKV